MKSALTWINHPGTPQAALHGIASGLLFTLAHKPFDLDLLIFLALVPLLRLIEAPWQQRLIAGWTAGLTMQLLGYSWIFITIRDFGGLHAVPSLGGAFLLWLWQGLDLAVWLTLFPKIIHRLPRLTWPFLAAVSFVLIQSYIFPYLFPWHLGAALSDSFFGAVALLLGVDGLTFFIIGAQTSLYLKTKPTSAFFVAVLMASPHVLPNVPWGWPKESETWRIGVIQPNILKMAKDSGGKASDFFTAHYDPSLKLRGQGLDLLIWPETAVPFDLGRNPIYYKRLQELAEYIDAPIITGVIEVPMDGQDYYNAVWMITADGKPPQKYRKEKLVAFSETMPWPLKWVTWFKSGLEGFVPGQENAPFTYRDKKIVPLICFEALFPRYVAKRQGHLMVNLTNDAWFGKTQASALHLQQIQLRAIETGMPLVRATNSGLSCWIDDWSNPHQLGKLYEPETHIFEVPIPKNQPWRPALWTMPKLPYVWTGLLAILLITAKIRKPKEE